MEKTEAGLKGLYIREITTVANVQAFIFSFSALEVRSRQALYKSTFTFTFTFSYTFI